MVLFIPTLFDPLVLLTTILGYALLFAVASFIAPKVANKLTGKIGLYSSMFLTGFLIVFIFVSIIVTLGYFYNPKYIYSILIFAVFFAILSNLITYLISPYMINFMFRAKEDPELQKLVDEVKNELGIKWNVKAYLVEGPPNAFAYGNILTGRLVAVTKSMMDLMDKNELKAVIGHELGHHLHRDNLFMILFGILPSIIYYLGYSLIFSPDERRSSGSLLIGIALVAISFLMQILILTFSRLREYYADSVGAKVSKEGMMYSLAKLYLIYKGNEELRNYVKSSSFRALFIYAFVSTLANPFFDMFEEENEENNEEIKIEKIKVDKETIEKIKNDKSEIGTIYEFLSTHPPIPKRLSFIESL